VKVSKRKVRYLVFEGGGGKGLIYLGAARALGEIGILEYYKKQVETSEVFRLNPKKIRGTAGTSVGSLAAVLVACGYTPDELHDILTKDFGIQILDKIEFGTIPTAYTKENPRYVIKERDIPEEQELLDSFWKHYIKTEKFSTRRMLKLPGKAINHFTRKFLASILHWYVDYRERQGEKSPEFSENSLFQIRTARTALEKVIHSNDSMSSLKYELGFFVSEFVRDFVDRHIEKKSGIKNCTFKQFYEEFKIDLVITGFNMTRNEVLYFRNDKQWKDLCIADAVRMSVSIPLIFKPVYLSYSNGTINPVVNDLSNGDMIVDGGVGNNFPLHVFDVVKSRSSKLNNHTLGFRFKRTKNNSDEDMTVAGYLENIGFALLGQTTELQFRTDDEKDQVLELENEAINTLNFLYSDNTQKCIDMAYETTMRYFK